MALLDETARQKLWRRFMELGHSPSTVLKADVRAAVNDLDAWVEANAAAINTALPQPFRGAATNEQKALLLAYIALERAGVL